MHSDIIEYSFEGVKLKGYFAWTGNAELKRPAILVAHTWKGQDDFARQKAHELAEIGYLGFTVDLYGNAITASNNEEASKLMLPLFLDRELLRNRINAAFNVVKELPMVQPKSIGAIGFCFGGLSVLELLRSGAPVTGAVSFHGLLRDTFKEHKAATCPIAENIHGSLLLLHGFEDPLVSPSDIRTIQEELDRAGIDWQMITYGHAMHAFTNPLAQDEKGGMMYNELADKRSWIAMCNFFEELFL